MKKLFFFIIALFALTNLFAQTNYNLVSSKTRLKGTSSLRDWQCAVENQTGTATINTAGKFNITALTIKMPVNSIRSINDDGSYFDASMDKNIYKTLNATAYPHIVYTLANISNVKTTGNVTTLMATGTLSIAGKTNKISFPVKATVSGRQITFTGSTKFKMSLFDVKPPTALMGTIKTGDDVTIVINTTYSR